jgi:hypothetical protein
MSNKKTSELYRQLADELDKVDELELQLKTEKQIRETTEEQLRIANTEVKIITEERDELADKAESFRLMAIEFREQAGHNADILTVINNLFNTYTMQDFIDLELLCLEAKESISSEDYDTIEEYEEEVEYADNLANLAEEVKIIKEEFFDGSKGQED